MRILFHIGVGNKDRPQRWRFVNTLYSNLALTLQKLGHSCLLWNHSQAHTNGFSLNRIVSDEVGKDALDKAIDFLPDWVFTWNGNSEGDKIISSIFNDKMIFGELGFFNHYKSVYFDFKGVGYNSENLTEFLIPFDSVVYEQIRNHYIKNRVISKKYIFVPLQDEGDTNITKYSPFSKMNDLLEYVSMHYTKETETVLYKIHPKGNKPALRDRKGFYEVTGDVHQYIPYAEKVIGINSNVLLESLIYHNDVVTLGQGITSRKLSRDEHKRYIVHLFKKQLKWEDLMDIKRIENSIFYNRMINV